MKKEIRRNLKQYYEVPEPQRKKAFLDKTQKIDISMQHMLLVQMQYIPKAVWAVSFLLFAVMFCLERYFPDSYVGMVYALVPFMVMITIAGGTRSYRYGMAELEKATCFSLKSVVLMRLLILGVGNVVLMFILAIMTRRIFIEEFLYLLAPYFLTASLGLAICRKTSGAEANYLFFGAAVLVSLAQVLLCKLRPFLYSGNSLGLWCIMVLLLFFVLAYQMKKTMQRMEEVVWN